MNLHNPAEFDAAYHDLRPVAVASALRVLRDPAAAEDVAQDVFTKLWRQPDLYDSRRGTLRHFVGMLARSRALDTWRSGRALNTAVERVKAETKAARQPYESADEPVIRRDERTRVLTALRGLPTDQRDALLLAYARGMSAGEISRERAIPLGTVKSRVRLGLQRARTCLEQAA